MGSFFFFFSFFLFSFSFLFLFFWGGEGKEGWFLHFCSSPIEEPAYKWGRGWLAAVSKAPGPSSNHEQLPKILSPVESGSG